MKILGGRSRIPLLDLFIEISDRLSLRKLPEKKESEWLSVGRRWHQVVRRGGCLMTTLQDRKNEHPILIKFDFINVGGGGGGGGTRMPGVVDVIEPPPGGGERVGTRVLLRGLRAVMAGVGF